MGFVTNLFKGFVRSTVNQVGRDSGRVISNRIYGNSHAAPVRMVRSEVSVREDVSLQENISQGSRFSLLKEGYKIEYFRHSIIWYFFLFIGSVILPFMGGFFWLYLSLRNFFKRKVRLYRITKEQLYVPDRRFRTGWRPEGFRNVRKHAPVEVEMTSSERMVFIIKGIVALAIGVFILSFQYAVYQT